MKRIAMLLSLGAAFAASIAWTQTAPQFTGKSETMDGKDLSVARRHFDAGARNLIAPRDGDEHRGGAIRLEVLDDVVDTVAMQRLVGAFAGCVDSDALGGCEHRGNGGERGTGRWVEHGAALKFVGAQHRHRRCSRS